MSSEWTDADFFKAAEELDRRLKMALGLVQQNNDGMSAINGSYRPVIMVAERRQPLERRRDNDTVCADCRLATLPGYERCWYCEELHVLRARSAAVPAPAQPRPKARKPLVAVAGMAVSIAGCAVGEFSHYQILAGCLWIAGLVLMLKKWKVR